MGLNILLVLLPLAANICTITADLKPPGEMKGKDIKEEILPPCQSCKVLVNSFSKGMTKTNKKHFGGGDTAWEEEKLGDYPHSEVRLIEVQEHLCSDVDKGQQQCYRLAEEWEHYIEEWWFKNQKLSSDLFDWLCIKRVQHCCPEHFYGPECKPCSGFPDRVCNNNGKCKGSGTRKGSGECDCNSGYTGPICDTCSNGFYQAYKDEEKLLCSKCHNSCESICSGPGPKGCVQCKKGWMRVEGNCLDINECLSSNPCNKNEFCINNEGSYTCLACDKSCDSCHGDGPDMCDKCGLGFDLREGFCIGKKQRGVDNLDWNRYMTYFGLCIATCIIFQKNTILASIVGLSVALYVSISEYMMSTMQTPKHISPEEITNLLEKTS